MAKKYFLTFSIIFLTVALISSCKSDDEGLTAIPIETNADFAQVLQTESVSINVLQNDTNVPTQGVLTVETPQNGTAQIIDVNNTPSNPFDDIVMYTADPSFIGDVTFEYTICEVTNCSTGTITVTVFEKSQVIFNINDVPYPKLSDYNFFEGLMSDQEPVYGVLPYKLINKLFTDYAHKKRFIWMPEGVSANYVSDHEMIDFPVGTVLIKTFYYEKVLPENTEMIIETRLMIKKEDDWIFANYLWNEDQTEADFDLVGGFADFEFEENGETQFVHYRIPSLNECFTCHKADINNIPIGPKPQSINSDYNFEDGTQNQLQKWIEMGYLENNLPSVINTVPKWNDPSVPVNDRMRAYVDINCAHCHSEYGHCDYRPLRFAFNETVDEANIGVCVDPDTAVLDYTKIVDPSDLDNTLLYFRFSTVKEQYRMPLLGRSLVHQEAVDLVEEWVESLNMSCN